MGVAGPQLSPYKKTRHHTIPRARCRRAGIDPGFRGNIIPKPRYLHEAWHLLFGCMLPWEVSRVLKSRAFRLRNRRRRRAYHKIFGAISFHEAATIVESEWVGHYSSRVMDQIAAAF